MSTFKTKKGLEKLKMSPSLICLLKWQMSCINHIFVTSIPFHPLRRWFLKNYSLVATYIVIGTHTPNFTFLASVVLALRWCMYIWGFRARQHLRSLAPVMNDDGWLWWPNDIWGPWRPKASWHLSYRWGKTPKKPHPENLSRPEIEPGPAAWQARMLPLVPQRWTLCVSALICQQSPFHFFKRLFLKNPFLVVTYTVRGTNIPSFTFLVSVFLALDWYVSNSHSTPSGDDF